MLEDSRRADGSVVSNLHLVANFPEYPQLADLTPIFLIIKMAEFPDPRRVTTTECRLYEFQYQLISSGERRSRYHNLLPKNETPTLQCIAMSTIY